MGKKRIPPVIYPLGDIRLPEIEVIRLDNGIPLYHLTQTEQEVFSLDIVVDGGRPYERAPLVGRLTQLMIKEGNQHLSGEVLAEEIDYYGGTLRLPFDMDTCPIQLSGLHKHFEALVFKLAEVLIAPSFRQKDLDRVIERSVAQLRVELDKNETVAFRQITELLFGASHPYGYNSTESLYASVTAAQLQAHFQQCFHAGGIRLFLAGGAGQREIEVLNRSLGIHFPFCPPHQPVLPEPENTQGRFSFTGFGQKQTAMRLGRILFNRSHKDYQDLHILNTVFGGYFGSRLMTNIREDKGFTYNIYSALETMRYDGSWLIALETSPEKAEASLTEIHKEMKKLQNEPIDDSELSMVKNYLLGSMLSQIDGPLLTMELVSGLMNDRLPLSFFGETINHINGITADRLQDLAKAYLSPSDWTVVEVVPG